MDNNTTGRVATPEEAKAFVGRMGEVQGRCDRATKGPWYCVDVAGFGHLALSPGYDGCAVLGGINPGDTLTEKQTILNAECAAHARTDLPGALAVIRAYDAALREIVESIEAADLNAGSECAVDGLKCWHVRDWRRVRAAIAAASALLGENGGQKRG